MLMALSKRLLAVTVLAMASTACGAAKASHVTLSVRPYTSLLDQPVHIVVRGAPPRALVTVRLTQFGWVGAGVFRASRSGVVNVANARSLGGTYRGVSSMGIFWSMAPPRTLQRRQPFDGGTAQITVAAGKTTLTQTRIVRLAQRPALRIVNLTVADDGFDGRYFAPRPADNQRTPILLFGGSEGGLSTTAEARLFASHGFPALAIAYFGAPGLPPALERIPLEYFVTAARWLARQPGVDASRLTVYGVSRGTEAALELADHFPTIFRAVIGIAPTAEVQPGQPVSGGSSTAPAWTLASRGLSAYGPNAAIPVSAISGPVLLACGKQDAVWPACFSTQTLAAKLRAAHKQVTALSYANAGHIGVPVPYLPWLTSITTPSGLSVSLGGSLAGNAEARINLWPRLLRFLADVR